LVELPPPPRAIDNFEKANKPRTPRAAFGVAPGEKSQCRQVDGGTAVLRRVSGAVSGALVRNQSSKGLKSLVGAGRFELPTPCSRSNRVRAEIWCMHAGSARSPPWRMATRQKCRLPNGTLRHELSVRDLTSAVRAPAGAPRPTGLRSRRSPPPMRSPPRPGARRCRARRARRESLPPSARD
jgi:hypothetical protein